MSNEVKIIFRFDLIILFSALSLSVIGILFIYSSGISSDGILQSNEYIKQIVWVCIGAAMMISVSFLDYERLRTMTFYIYFGTIALLVIVLIIGNVVNGAKSWINLKGIGFQPSEFMKIALILRLACFFEDSKNKYSEFTRFILSLVQTAIPMLLVVIQPDMGTAMVYFPIYLIMAFAAGIRKRYLLFILACGALIIIGVMIPAWDNFIVTGKAFSWQRFFLKRSFINGDSRSRNNFFIKRCRLFVYEKEIFLLDRLCCAYNDYCIQHDAGSK